MVQVAIEVTATTSMMEEETTSPVKEFTPSYEEEASIEIDLSGITEEEDCREPDEAAGEVCGVTEERAAEDQGSEESRAPAADEPALAATPQASCFLANPVALNPCKSIADYAAMLQPSPEPSFVGSPEPSVVAPAHGESLADAPETPSEEPARESSKTEIAPDQLKPSITIDRRARTLPAFNVNSIANITYVDPLHSKESVLGADLRDASTPVSTNESLPPVDDSAKIDGEEGPVESTAESKQTLASSITSKSRYVVKIANVKSKSMSRGMSRKIKNENITPPIVEKEVETEEQVEEKSEVTQEPEQTTVPDVSKSQDVPMSKSSEQNSVNEKSVAEIPIEPVAYAKSVADDYKTCVSVKSADRVEPEETKSNDEASKTLSSISIAALKSRDSISFHDSIQHTATNSSNSVTETVEVTKAPSLEPATDESKTTSSRLSRIGRSVSRARSSSSKRIGRSVSRARSSSTKRVQQLKSAASASSKKLISTSKSTTSNSPLRVSPTSKSYYAESSKLVAMSTVRAKSIPWGQTPNEIKTEDVAQTDSTECIPLDVTAVAGDLNITPLADDAQDVADTKPEDVSGDEAPDENVENGIANAADKKQMESTPSETIASHAKNVDLAVPENAPALANPNVPTSPVSKTPVAGGFMGRFFSGLFCKTEDLMDFSTLCGGASAIASPVAAQAGVSLNTIQRAIESPSATNAVEVKPIFDEPEPVPAAEEAKFVEGTSEPVCPIDPITTSLEPTPSIDLQSSSLRSTKSNKSLTLITEVKSQPSKGSINDTPTSVLLSAAERNVEAENSSPVPEQSEASVSTKPTGKKMDLRIVTSFSKKAEQAQPSDGSADKEKDKKSVSSTFNNITSSLKASLKSLSPRSAGVSLMGFKRSSQDKEEPTECPSPVKTRQPVPSDDPDLDGIRIYGGGVTVPSEDKTQYPKFALDYKRKAGGLRGLKKQMSRRMSHVKETTMTYNKVLRHQMVKASQPKVRAIMTNHVPSGASYRKEQAANALN